MNFSVSAKEPVIVRAKIKSKGSVQVHSFSRSSISKMQFGGTLKLLVLCFDDSWGNLHGRLDWAEINTDHLGFGMSIGWYMLISSSCIKAGSSYHIQ